MNEKTLLLLNEQQNLIVNAKEKKIIVSAGPGSGKTYTLVKRIKKELSENDYSIIVTSFTREAAGQLKAKLSRNIDLKDSYIGTLDSFVLTEIIDKFKNRYLNIKGYTTIKKLKFIMPSRDSLVEKITREGIVSSNKHLIINCMNEWFEQFTKGVYEISSICYLIAIDLMQICATAKLYLESKYRTIYIDEAQDLNEYQHKFIDYLVNVCNLSIIYIGDKNQSIYQFRGSRPELFYQLKNKDEFKEYIISVSVRCDASILAFSNLIIDDNSEIPEIYENKVFLNVAPTQKTLCSVHGNFLILFENNEDAIKCFEYCKKNNINAIYTKKIELSNKDVADEYLDLIEEIVRFRINVDHKNSKLVYSIDDFIEFLSNDFIVNSILKEEIERIDLDLISYLLNLLNALKIYLEDDVIAELKNLLNFEVYSMHYLKHENENRIMTIHSSKGLEADNVFVRIAKCPYKINDEYRRKLFVAFSRAKNNLYISYKEQSILNSSLDCLLKKNLDLLNNKLGKGKL